MKEKNNYNRIKNLVNIFLHEFYRTKEIVPSFPIDIEGIVKYLDYNTTFYNLKDGVNAITDMISRVIFISNKTNPYKYRAMLGRYNFTLAHEIGHIILHEKIYFKLLNEKNNNGKVEEITDNENIEREADFFAANLLLPIDLLKHEFKKNFGDKRIIIKGDKFYPDFSSSIIDFFKNKTHASEPAIVIALKQAGLIGVAD
ncbi:MAG: ImmA/IrrE family metallo-endopeptidase [Candidatus Cloacimonetes bacterium]|nr:ImmA/IrrE family metallo-endopeptidase [Candidatus Cloacimonadota bacterium]